MEYIKIKNPETDKYIYLYGDTYLKLLKKGYTEDFLLNEQITTKKPPNKKTLLLINNKNPKTQINEIISTNFINYLNPNDLLSLYLSNKQNKNMLDNKNIIRKLNQNYNIKYETDNFISWYKYYNNLLINKDIGYLYSLENELYIDKKVIDDIINNDNNNIIIIFNWLYEIYKKTSYLCFQYACTLFLIFLSRKMIDKKDFQLYVMVSLNYASLMFKEFPPDVSDYIYISNGNYNKKQFENASVDMFNILNGQLIYPVSVLFIDQSNDDLKLLTSLTSLILNISFYKPSLIAETCTYMITGKYKIYSLQEISYICKIIYSNLNKLSNVKLSINTKVKYILDKIKYPCHEENKEYILQPLKYNKKWHIGDFEKLDLLGEGTYGKVKKIKRKECGIEYAVKITKNKDFINEACLEISILTLLKNQYNIIPLCGFSYESTKIKMILPLLFNSLTNLTFEKKNMGKYFKQIIIGVKQIHDHDIIHRDLKPDNILYDKNNDILNIIDFGLSVPFQSFKITNNVDLANTLTFRPPECLFINHPYNQKIDIWAIGCIFYWIVTKQYLSNSKNVKTDIFKKLGTPTIKSWPELKKLTNIKSIPKYEGEIQKIKKKLEPYSELILDCLTINPNKRPTANELLQMYFS